MKRKEFLRDFVKKSFWLTAESKCPVCGQVLTAATSTGVNRKPRENDLSICIGCGMLLMFNADFSPRKLTDEELKDVKASNVWPRLKKILETFHKVVE